MSHSETFPAVKRCLCNVKTSWQNIIINIYCCQGEIGICNVGFEDLLNIVFILSTAQQQRLLRASCKILVLGLHVNQFLHAGNTEDWQS